MHGQVFRIIVHELEFTKPLNESDFTGISDFSGCLMEMVLICGVLSPGRVLGRTSPNRSEDLHAGEGVFAHRQPGELHDDLLLGWRPLAQQSVGLTPGTLAECLQLRDVQGVRSLCHVAGDVAQKTMVAVSALNVSARPEERLQQLHEAAPGGVRATGDVVGRPARQEIRPEHGMDVQRAARLKLEAKAPMPDFCNTDLLQAATFFQDVLLQQRLQGMVEMQGEDRLLLAECRRR